MRRELGPITNGGGQAVIIGLMWMASPPLPAGDRFPAGPGGLEDLLQGEQGCAKLRDTLGPDGYIVEKRKCF